MTNLLATLGIDNVSADPNDLPDGRWAGAVQNSQFVVKKTDNSVAHVITYVVTDGDRKGAQRTEWFTLGNNVTVDEKGNITGYVPTMSEDQMRWYKKRWTDLGIAEDKITETDPSELKGRLVTFGTKRNGNYVNINFVELRGANANAVNSQVSGDPWATPPVESQASGSISDLI